MATEAVFCFIPSVSVLEGESNPGICFSEPYGSLAPIGVVLSLALLKTVLNFGREKRETVHLMLRIQAKTCLCHLFSAAWYLI